MVRLVLWPICWCGQLSLQQLTIYFDQYMMQSQNSKSKTTIRPHSFNKKRKASPPRKKATSVPKMSPNNPSVSSLSRSYFAAIGDALLRRYSGTQNKYYLSVINKTVDQTQKNSYNIKLTDLRCFVQPTQHLNRLIKPSALAQSMRHALAKYQLHREMPRIFIEDVNEIIKKCHHNRRILDYVRLARMLGMSINNQQLLTFIRSFQGSMTKKSFTRMLGQISSYNFSNRDQLSQQNPQKVIINSIDKLIKPFKLADGDPIEPTKYIFKKPTNTRRSNHLYLEGNRAQ